MIEDEIIFYKVENEFYDLSSSSWTAEISFALNIFCITTIVSSTQVVFNLKLRSLFFSQSTIQILYVINTYLIDILQNATADYVIMRKLSTAYVLIRPLKFGKQIWLRRYFYVSTIYMLIRSRLFTIYPTIDTDENWLRMSKIIFCFWDRQLNPDLEEILFRLRLIGWGNCVFELEMRSHHRWS